MVRLLVVSVLCKYINENSFMELIKDLSPLFFGVLVALFSLEIQKKKDTEAFKKKEEFENRMTLLNSYIFLLGELSKYISKITIIQIMIKNVLPTMPKSSFVTIDIRKVSGFEVLDSLQKTVNSISLNSIRCTTNNFLKKLYCDEIEKNVCDVLKPDIIPNIFYDFENRSIKSARFLKGEDLRDFFTLESFVMSVCDTSLKDISFYELKKKVEEYSLNCEKRLSVLI